MSITDPDPAPEGSDVEVVEISGEHFVKVTGLAENTEVTVTVGMTKDGFAPGSSTVTGTSLAQKTDPALTDPVTRTADGFTSKITNWTEGYAYPTTITSPLSVPDGAEAVVEVGEGGFHYLVVRGFGANQPVSVTVGMTKDGFTPGSSSITGTSLQAKVDPALTDPVTRTADGFTSKITNWNAGFAYPVSISPAPEGSNVEVVEVGQDHFVKVTGLAHNTQVTATVESTQAGYVSGSASITGTSLQAKVDPALTDPVTRTADGFRSKITNWNVGFAYPTAITLPSSIPQGAEAAVEVGEGGFHYLVVRGFAPNQEVSVTVGSTQAGYVSGSASITGTSLQAKVDPALLAATRTADGFRSKITNWAVGYAYPTDDYVSGVGARGCLGDGGA